MPEVAGVGVLGFKGKIYVVVATVDTEIKSVGDVNIPRKATEIDVSSRENLGTQAWTRGLREFGAQFTMQKRKGGTAYEALRTAWETEGATVVIKACDGPIATVGTEILTMTCEVTDFSDAQPINGVQTKNVVLKPSWYAAAPPAQTTAT